MVTLHGLAGRTARWLRSLWDEDAATSPRPNQGRPQFFSLCLDIQGRPSQIATRRLQLRIEPDGAGVLWIDACEAVYLNPVAAFVAGQAIQGVSPRSTVGALHRRFRRASLADRAEAVTSIYAMIDTLKTPGEGCALCGVQGLVQRPIFSAASSSPHKADLALTYACNNSCGHCYNPPERRAMPAVGEAGFRRVLARLVESGIPHVVFTGGEPTLLESLPRLIRFAEGLGLATGVNTNGRLLAAPGYAETLRNAGLDHVQITLESHEASIHDAMTGAASFGETVEGIRAALRAGLHTMTNTTLTLDNAAGALALVDMLHGLGLRTFAMNGMIHAGCGKGHPRAISHERLAPLLAAVRQQAADLRMRFLWYTPTQYCRLSPLALELGPRRCNAGEYSICVEPNGDVLPCQSYYEPAGNLLSDSWESIWNIALMRGFRNRTTDPTGFGLSAACGQCADLEICGGGCPLDRAAADGVGSRETAKGGRGVCV